MLTRTQAFFWLLVRFVADQIFLNFYNLNIIEDRYLFLPHRIDLPG
jgi:hypothetical protein